MKVLKKSGELVNFNRQKIKDAVNKSSERVMVNLTEDQLDLICNRVEEVLQGNDFTDYIKVEMLHIVVENALEEVDEKVAKSYRDYRNYKKNFVGMLDEVYKKAEKIMYLGDKDNSNTDSALVSTKRSLVYGELNKELYNQFFLNTEEKQACRDGYIYIHDKSARRDAINCCLFNAKEVMQGGFEMGNMWYNEPKTVDTACDVLGDIIMMSASMQYGE